jgi:hypothetical protein
MLDNKKPEEKPIIKPQPQEPIKVPTPPVVIVDEVKQI